MKTILVSLFFLLTSSLFANAAEEHIAELNLSVDIVKICQNQEPFCFVSKLKLGNERIPLIPQNGDYMCDDVGNCSQVNTTHYRGVWSSVIEIDGLRAIGIVSIDKHKVDLPDGVLTYGYSITLEIIGDSGLQAKAKINTTNLSTLNAMTLESLVYEHQGNEYRSELFIGPKIDLSDPLPCNPQSDDPNECKNHEKSQESEYILLKGNIKE